MQKLLVVCGPTAVGKTQLALKIARALHGSIVSVDSRQMYVGLDIGAGKDIPPGFAAKKTEAGISVYSDGNVDIYGYDVFAPSSLQSPSQLEKKLRHVLEHLSRIHVVPILVSGSGNYVDALLSPPPTAAIPPNLKLRVDLGAKQVDTLQSLLMDCDQKKLESMNQSDRNNPRRLIRAIEVASFLKQQTTTTLKPKRFDILWIGLTASKKLLEEKIKHRVEQRMLGAVVEETRILLRTYPGCESLLNVTLGYQQVLEFLSGSISEDELKRNWSLKEYQYAKRQLTWFKKNRLIHWFDINEPRIDTAVMNLLQSEKDFGKNIQ